MSNLLSESRPIRLSVLQEQNNVKFSRSLIDGHMMINSSRDHFNWTVTGLIPHRVSLHDYESIMTSGAVTSGGSLSKL